MRNARRGQRQMPGSPSVGGVESELRILMTPATSDRRLRLTQQHRRLANQVRGLSTRVPEQTRVLLDAMPRLSVSVLPYLPLSTVIPLMVEELVAPAEGEAQVPTLRCKDTASACWLQWEGTIRIP